MCGQIIWLFGYVLYCIYVPGPVTVIVGTAFSTRPRGSSVTIRTAAVIWLGTMRTSHSRVWIAWSANCPQSKCRARISTYTIEISTWVTAFESSTYLWQLFNLRLHQGCEAQIQARSSRKHQGPASWEPLNQSNTSAEWAPHGTWHSVNDHEWTHFVLQGRPVCCISPKHEVCWEKHIFHRHIDSDPNPCTPLCAREYQFHSYEYTEGDRERKILKSVWLSPLFPSSPSFSHQAKIIGVVSKNLVTSWSLTGSDVVWTCQTPAVVLRDTLASATDAEQLPRLLSLTTRHWTLEETTEKHYHQCYK